MSEEEVGWIKTACQILVQCRGIVIDDFWEWKRILLVFYIPITFTPSKVFANFRR